MTDACCEIPRHGKVKLSEENQINPNCPRCTNKGQAVELVTLRHHIKPPVNLEVTDGSYLFCRTPTCPVVYFSNKEDRIFEKKDVRYRIGLKEIEAPHDVCYCFGFTREMIEQDMRERGKTDIPAKISAEVKAGNCACEIKNPQGHCCLGNVQKAMQNLQKATTPKF